MSFIYVYVTLYISPSAPYAHTLRGSPQHPPPANHLKCDMTNDFILDKTITASTRNGRHSPGTMPSWHSSVAYKNKLNTCRSSLGPTPSYHRFHINLTVKKITSQVYCWVSQSPVYNAFNPKYNTNNKVQLQECWPSWQIENKTYSTEALATFCPQENIPPKLLASTCQSATRTQLIPPRPCKHSGRRPKLRSHGIHSLRWHSPWYHPLLH
jgi:hypothetical protein